MSQNKFKVSSLRQFPQFINLDGLTGEEEIQRKQYVSNDIYLDENDEKSAVMVISTTSIDADNEIVMPEGCVLNRFMKNPVVLSDHRYQLDSIVGKATKISVQPNCIIIKTKFADSQKANDVWGLVKGGFARTSSIGFIVNKSIVRGQAGFDDYVKSKGLKADGCNRIITEFELMENSLVALPSNQDATVLEVSQKSVLMAEDTLKSLELDAAKLKSVVKEAVVEPVIEVKDAIVEVKQVTNSKDIVPTCNEDIIQEEPKIERSIKILRLGGPDLDSIYRRYVDSKRGKII